MARATSRPSEARKRATRRARRRASARGTRTSPSNASPRNSASSANGGAAASRRLEERAKDRDVVRVRVQVEVEAADPRVRALRARRRAGAGSGSNASGDDARRRAGGGGGDLGRRAQGLLRGHGDEEPARSRLGEDGAVRARRRGTRAARRRDGRPRATSRSRSPRATRGARGARRWKRERIHVLPCARSASDAQPSSVALFPAASWKRSRSAGSRMRPVRADLARPHPRRLAEDEAHAVAADRARGVRVRERAALLVGGARDGHVLEEPAELGEQERLRPVDERLRRVRVEVHEHHVRARGDALRRDVHEVRDAVRRAVSRLPTECDGSMQTGRRVSRLTTGTCAKSTRLRCGSPRFVLTPRRPKTICELPSEARYSAALSDSLSVIPKPRFTRTGNTVCRPTVFRSSKFWMLRVPIWSMTPVGRPVFSRHSAISSMWLSCVISIAMTRMPCLPAFSKTHGQAALAVALERVRVRARLVRAHARRRLPERRERREHRLDVLRRVDGAEPGEDVQVVLRELDAVVREAARAPVVLVAADDAVLLRHAHDALDAGQDGDVLDGEAVRVADEVDLGDGLLGARGPCGRGPRCRAGGASASRSSFSAAAFFAVASSTRTITGRPPEGGRRAPSSSCGRGTSRGP